jgi:hypothetical protein
LICGGDGITFKNGAIDFTNLGGYTKTTASTVNLQAKSSATSSQCDVSVGPTNVDIASPSNASLLYGWSSDGKSLKRLDGKGGTFTESSASNQVYRDGGASCSNIVILQADNVGREYDLSGTSGSGPGVTQFSDLSDIFNNLDSC